MLWAEASALDIIWAEAVGLAAWILTWGGYGQHIWDAHEVSRRRLLGVGAVIWLLGWFTIRPGSGQVPVNLGWGAMAAVALLLAARDAWLRHAVTWMVLGTVAALMRSIAPINPYQASVVPWLAPEAVSVGLLAAAAGGGAWAGALAAAGASLVSSLWRVWAMPAGASLGAPDWLYTVLSILTAWMVGTLMGPRRVGDRV
jgi:hypothetical protein